MITCAFTAILYPFVTLNDLSTYYDSKFYIIMCGEIIMLFDIIINLLLAFKDDDDLRYITDISKTSQNYIYHGSFVKDVIIWLPILPLTLVFKGIKYI